MKNELLTIAKKHNYTVKVKSALRDERTTPKTFSIFQSGHSKPCLRKHMSRGRKAKIPIAQNNYCMMHNRYTFIPANNRLIIIHRHVLQSFLLVPSLC